MLRSEESRSLLTGLLFDDRGNRMSPSPSSKRGWGCRFYVSSALLTGRRDDAGSVSRVSAPDLEGGIVSALRERFAQTSGDLNDQDLVGAQIERIVLGQTTILITLKEGDATGNLIEIDQRRRDIHRFFETGMNRMVMKTIDRF